MIGFIQGCNSLALSYIELYRSRQANGEVDDGSGKPHIALGSSGWVVTCYPAPVRYTRGHRYAKAQDFANKLNYKLKPR